MDIIFMNGPSSAGKSSVARLLRAELEKTCECRVMALDDYMSFSPEHEVFEDEIFDIMSRMGSDIAALKQGCRVIIDHVVTSQRIYDSLIRSFGGKPFFSVLFVCDMDILKAREVSRGDRFPGSAEASMAFLYPKDRYDLTVDSSVDSSEEIAAKILNGIRGGAGTC